MINQINNRMRKVYGLENVQLVSQIQQIVN
jgi:hypothetical protein